MYFTWKIITLAVLQTIFFAIAVAIYADPGNPFFYIMLSSAGPWIGALIGAMRAPKSLQEIAIENNTAHSRRMLDGDRK